MTCWKPASRAKRIISVAPLLHPPVLGGDRGLPHPFLEARDALRMALHDLGLDGVEAVVGAQDLWKRERGRGHGRGTQEIAASEWAHGASLAAQRRDGEGRRREVVPKLSYNRTSGS